MMRKELRALPTINEMMELGGKETGSRGKVAITNHAGTGACSSSDPQLTALVISCQTQR
jgi:hypothetical protein